MDDEESDRRKPSPNVPGGAGYKFGLELHIGQQFATASELHAQMIIFHCSSVGLPVSLLSLVKIACGRWRVRQTKAIPKCSRRSGVQIWTRTAHWATICTSFWASCPNNKIPSLSRCYGQSLMYVWSFVQYAVTKLVFVSNYWGISWSTTSSSHVFTNFKSTNLRFFSRNFLWCFFC